jgi:hypothetical protein
MNLFSSLTHAKETEYLLMSWAEHHPYLFTLIEVVTPSIWVIFAVAAFNSINGILRRKTR